jgi:hypothetical protein
VGSPVVVEGGVVGCGLTTGGLTVLPGVTGVTVTGFDDVVVAELVVSPVSIGGVPGCSLEPQLAKSPVATTKHGPIEDFMR